MKQQDILEMTLKRLEELEKKLEQYYYLLQTENELDFVLNGTYLTESDLSAILTGNYT